MVAGRAGPATRRLRLARHDRQGCARGRAPRKCRYGSRPWARWPATWEPARPGQRPAKDCLVHCVCCALKRARRHAKQLCLERSVAHRCMGREPRKGGQEASSSKIARAQALLPRHHRILIHGRAHFGEHGPDGHASADSRQNRVPVRSIAEAHETGVGWGTRSPRGTATLPGSHLCAAVATRSKDLIRTGAPKAHVACWLVAGGSGRPAHHMLVANVFS